MFASRQVVVAVWPSAGPGLCLRERLGFELFQAWLRVLLFAEIQILRKRPLVDQRARSQRVQALVLESRVKLSRRAAVVRGSPIRPEARSTLSWRAIRFPQLAVSR